jgi:hypothetical protein
MNQRYSIALAFALTVFGCKQTASPQSAAGPGFAGSGVAGLDVSGAAGQGAPVATVQSAAGSGGSGAAVANLDPNSFSAIYKDIIVGVGCNGGTLCHAGMVGNLTMNSRDQAYTALVGTMAMGMNLSNTMNKSMNCKDSGLMRVVVGKPDESLLMLKVERMQPCGDPMPATPLAADKVAQIRAWITNGAKND